MVRGVPFHLEYQGEKAPHTHTFSLLGGRFGYFLFFSVRGGGRGVRGARGGWEGIGCLLKIPEGGGGGVSPGGGGAGRVSAANWGILRGGGAKYFFSGPKRPPSLCGYAIQRCCFCGLQVLHMVAARIPRRHEKFLAAVPVLDHLHPCRLLLAACCLTFQFGSAHGAGRLQHQRRICKCNAIIHKSMTRKKKVEAFVLTVRAFLLTVKLLCLQSLKALIRCTFPL